MAEDVVTIWNRALTAAGSQGSISLPTEVGREADLCRLWYPNVRDTLLKSASWPCAQAYARLAVKQEAVDGEAWSGGYLPPNWRFAYAAPADMLAPRYLMSFRRFSTGIYNDERLVFANSADEVLHYTMAQNNPGLWDTALRTAVTAALAAKLCIPLSAKAGRAEKLKEEAVEAVLLARTEFANESDEVFDALPSWVSARGYNTIPWNNRFIWPSEDVNSVGFI
jgi:hypothetical protein